MILRAICQANTLYKCISDLIDQGRTRHVQRGPSGTPGMSTPYHDMRGYASIRGLDSFLRGQAPIEFAGSRYQSRMISGSIQDRAGMYCCGWTVEVPESPLSDVACGRPVSLRRWKHPDIGASGVVDLDHMALSMLYLD